MTTFRVGDIVEITTDDTGYALLRRGMRGTIERVEDGGEILRVDFGVNGKDDYVMYPEELAHASDEDSKRIAELEREVKLLKEQLLTAIQVMKEAEIENAKARRWVALQKLRGL